MFINNLDPVAFELFGLQIRYYGLVYFIGFLLTYYILFKATEKKLIKGFKKQLVEDYIFYLIIFSILGARLFEVVFWNPSFYFTNLFEIIKIWKGGLSLHGGFAGSVLYSWWFCKKHKINFYQLGDIIVLPTSFFLFLGRLANYVNSELIGRVTNVNWGVNFNNEISNGELIYRHPYQIYVSLKNFLITIILTPIYFSKKLRPGTIFGSFIILYGLGRFVLDFYKLDDLILGLNTGQWLNLIMIIIGFLIIYRRSLRRIISNIK